MTDLDIEGVGAWLVIVSGIWAVVLFFTDPTLGVKVALAAASVGLLLLTAFDTDEDQDDGPPTADDLKDD